MTTTIEYIGHSAFYIKKDAYGILIDPFISANPCAKFDMNNTVTDILVTHGHADHLGDALEISRDKKSVITCVFELANYCMSKGAYTNSINLGGKIEYPWGIARFLPAFHSSSDLNGHYTGMPAAILIEIDGIKIYHAGDTCLNSEIKLAGELYSPDIALLPIGSCFTMDSDDAVIAAQWLNSKLVAPMHYNTFPPIKTDVNKFIQKVEAIGKKCILTSPGEKITL